ncbi:DUF418 domain-containing protein [uncultured Maribacter sp.]|uniref:DUF418 domain-containing protein n=1 Tax=uncultured Maribacter sp. TaxID=431308 RepID=UPI002632CF8A|nr:DUF418 domain-containing protein [uncultured Maribacter sp.]
MTNQSDFSTRIHAVDALRGFAIVSIMLLHNLEHFDVYFLPPNLPDWMVQLDKKIWDTSFFLFAGKSYAIFALLFGLTFFIQTNNQEKKGKDFRLIFAWRLVLLLVFGFINSAFYQGDILTIYAALGFFIIPFSKMNNKAIFIISLLLLAQPIELANLYSAIQNPNLEIANPKSWTYFGKMDSYIKADSFIDTVYGNLTNGKLAVLQWSHENGRYAHILALFLLGMLGGRVGIFSPSKKNRKIWLKCLLLSFLAFVILYYVQKNILPEIDSKIINRSITIIEKSWTNIAFMLVLVSSFLLLFQSKIGAKILHYLSPIGKMSLSNYIIQSILGSSIYYGFGLGLYKYTGATYSMLLSIVLAIIMGIFSTWWMHKNKRGPLETLWHKATWAFSRK